jgi:hypothetical protein
MQNVTSIAAGAAGPDGRKSLKEHAVSLLKRYAVISAYLWLLFALFSLHKQLVQGHGISIWQQGFAIVNALVLGRVFLIGEVLNLGKGQDNRSLVSVVLRKSLIFAILLLAFRILEEVIRVWFEGRPLSASFTEFGDSPLAGVVSYAAIFFVVLIPFFAWQAAARVLGSGALLDLFFRPHVNRIRLIEDLATEP